MRSDEKTPNGDFQMTAADFILGLLEARTHHACSCALTPADTDEDPWPDLRPLYSAQANALRAVTQEIRASLTRGDRPTFDTSLQKRTKWLFVTEIGGVMTAKIFNELAPAREAKERFCTDHHISGDFAPHAACSLEALTLPQRRTPAEGQIDGRFVLIVHAYSRVSAEIFETLEEVEAALDEVEDLHGDDGLCSYHKILVPA